jgi:hypothetical protein
VGVLYADGIGQEIRLEFLTQSSFVRSEPIILGNQMKAFSVYKEYVLIAVDDKLLLINAKKNQIVSDMTIDEDVIRLSLISKDKAVLITMSGVREIRL